MNRNNRQRQRCVYPSARQKKKLLEYVSTYPVLVKGRQPQNVSYSESQQLWVKIANECNTLPGAKKSWQQWRKTWQDLKSKTKKRYTEGHVDHSSSVLLTQAEREVLGLKDVSSTSNYQETTEFVNSGTVEQGDDYNNEDESMVTSYESLASPSEDKVFTDAVQNKVDPVPNYKERSEDNKHSNSCVFNCNKLAKLEQRKMDLKEEYLNFKKDYLRQKLELMRQQTEALKSIAKELSTK